MRGTKRKISKEIEKVPYEERTQKKRTLPAFQPHDQTGYWNYRRNRKTDNKIGENRSLYSKSVRSIWKAVKELILENEGGVFLEEYGYFNGMVLPWLDKGSEIPNRKDPYFHTDGYTYCLQLFSTITRKSCIRGMIMDRTFDKRMVKDFSAQLYETEYRPKLYATAIESAFGYKKTKYK